MVLGVLNVADQFAAGFSGAQTFAANQARTDSLRQSQQETQLKLDAESNRTLSDQLANKGYFDLNASNSDGILNLSTTKLLENDKELALQLFNRIPTLKTATLDNGVKVGVEAVDYFKSDDGSISFIMQRSDNGKRVPLTQGRTESGDDVIAKFSPEDLDKVAGTAMVDVLSNGGFGSRFAYMQQLENMRKAEVRAETERAANELAANSTEPGAQAMASQLSFLLRTTDDIEALETIATDFGVDLEAVRKTAAAKTQANITAANADTTPDTGDAQPDATPAEITGDLSAVASARQSLEDLRKDIKAGSQRGIGSENQKLINTAKEDLDSTLEALPEIQKLREEQNALPNNRRGQTEKAQIAAKIRKEKERLIKLSQEDGGAKDPEGGDATPPALPELTREQLIPLIQEASQNPEYISRTRQVLQNAGVTNLTQLRQAVKQNRVPPKEANDAIVAAAMFAASQPGAKYDAAEYVQRFRNQVLRSSQTYDLEDAIEDDRKERTLDQTIASNQTTKARLSLDRRKFFRTLAQDEDIQQPVLEDFENIFKAFDTAQDKGDTVDESRDIQAAFRTLGSRLKGSPGSPMYESAKKLWPNATAEYIRQAAIEEGAPTIPDWFKDFLRGDSPLSIGDLSRNLVRRADGVIGIMDPDGAGQIYESPITIGRLRQLMSVDESTFMGLEERRF